LALDVSTRGIVHTAKIPKALIEALESNGMAALRRHPSGAVEIFFRPDAMQYVMRFFK